MMEPYTPQQTCEIWLKTGRGRHQAGPLNAFLKSVSGGMLLSLGGILYLDLVSLLATNYLGLNKLVGAAVFPIGLIMISLSSVDLVTSNMAIMLMAAVKRKIPFWGYVSNLVMVTLGNFVGSLLIAGLLGVSTGIFDSPASKTFVATFAVAKVVTPTFANIVARGIGCNILVCYASYFAVSSREIISKVVIIWACVATFVALGFDHVVANMLFVPLALMQGEVPFTIGYYLWKSFIAAWIGNALGGAFMALPLTYFYLMGDSQLPTTTYVDRSNPFTSFRKSKNSAKVEVEAASSTTSSEMKV